MQADFIKEVAEQKESKNFVIDYNSKPV